MTDLLHQLENNEAILLMYLADELSVADRAEFEQQLASDVSLRAELESLRGLHDATIAALERADATYRLPVSETVAARRAARMMRQWQIANAHAPRAPEDLMRQLRFPWWSYPLTTAAAVLIAFLVWWGNGSDPLPRRPVAAAIETPAGASDLAGWQAELAGEYLIESFDSSEEDVVTLAINQPVDAGLERLNLTASRPHDVDAIFLNATERNW